MATAPEEGPFLNRINAARAARGLPPLKGWTAGDPVPADEMPPTPKKESVGARLVWALFRLVCAWVLLCACAPDVAHYLGHPAPTLNQLIAIVGAAYAFLKLMPTTIIKPLKDE